MKILLSSLFIMYFGISSYSQNILKALELQQNAAELKYSEGESMSNDTIIDLVNGYYAEVHKEEGIVKSPLREATIFRNEDGTTTLAISIRYWDFACMVYYSKFYEISKSGKSIKPIKPEQIIPPLKTEDFIENKKALSILKSKISTMKENNPDDQVDLDYVFKRNFSLIYRLPQKGKSITVLGDFCDIVAEDYEFDYADYEIVKNAFSEVQLTYNSKLKKFTLK